MRRFVVMVPAIALLAIGAEGLVRVYQGQQVVTTTCDEVARTGAPPRVRITGCDVDIAGAAYRESGGRVVELFFPIRPVRPAGNRTEAAPIVAAVRDEQVLASVQQILGAQNAAAEETLRTIADRLHLSSAIDGVARVSIVERLRSRRVLAALPNAAATNAAIVDVNGRVHVVSPALAVAGGLLLVALPWLVRSRRVPAPAAHVESHIEPETAAAVAAPPVPQPSAAQPSRVSVLLPRLLLLNVDPSSGPEAVENAPPLGMRHDVVRILSGVVPDLELTGADTAIARPDGSLKFELGRIDPVATVVVDARGEAGVALVKEVLLMTGWRAFAPKTGLFITPDDLEALAALAASS